MNRSPSFKCKDFSPEPYTESNCVCRITSNDFIREAFLAIGLVLLILGSLWIATGQFPPMVVVESGSMMHDTEDGSLGAIDPGDLVLVMNPDRVEIITYVEAMQENNEKKLNCYKLTKKGEVKAVSYSNELKPIIEDWHKKFNVTEHVKMKSSFKFCVIATGEYDIYAAKERANEWDYAAGHAVAANAGAIITTLDKNPFLYGKEDYRNPSLLILRSKNLNV